MVIILLSVLACILILGIGIGIAMRVHTIPCTGKVVLKGTNEGIQHVSVTDGRHVVKTDSDGNFKLSGWCKSKFVAVTIPSGYWTEDYYIPIEKEKSTYVFELDKAKKDRTNHNFLQVSDTEIGEKGAEPQWINALKETAKEQDSAFIIQTGDICYIDGLKQHIRDMNTENMGVPVRYVIGNHDYVDYGKYGEQLFEEIYGPVWYSFEVGNIHYVVTPIVHADRTPRYTLEDSYKWLKNDLKNTDKNKKIVLFNHDCPRDEENFTVQSGFTKIDLASEGLLAWVFGHLHYSYVYESNGVLAITTQPPRGGVDSSIGAIRTINIENDKIKNTVLTYMGFDKGESESGYEWQTQLGGRNLYAEPVLVGDKLYVATIDDDYPKTQEIACLSVHTGEKLWSFKPVNSIKNNIVIKENILVAEDCEGNVYALNAITGEKNWQKDLGLTWYKITSLGLTVSANNRIYCGNERHIHCLDLKTGETIWHKNPKEGDNSPNRMVISGDKLLVGANWRYLAGFDANTGKQKWTLKPEGFSWTTSTPLILDDTKALMFTNSSAFVFDYQKGELLKRKEFPARDFLTVSTPLLIDGVLYVPTTHSGIVAIDYNTLEEKWNFKTGNALVNSAPYSIGEKSTVEGSLIMENGILLFGADDGYLYAVDKDGNLMDKFNIGSPIFTKVIYWDGNVITADFSGHVTSVKFDGQHFGK